MIAAVEVEKRGSLTLTRAEERVRNAMSAGKSPADIARDLGSDERFGYTPEEVYSIIRKILDSLDAYQLDEQLKLSILDLRELAAEAKENYRLTARAEHLRGAVEALDKAMVHLERLQDKSEDILTRLDAKQVQALVRIVEKSYERQLGVFEEQYEGFDREVAMEQFQRFLVAAAREVDGETR